MSSVLPDKMQNKNNSHWTLFLFLSYLTIQRFSMWPYKKKRFLSYFIKVILYEVDKKLSELFIFVPSFLKNKTSVSQAFEILTARQFFSHQKKRRKKSNNKNSIPVPAWQCLCYLTFSISNATWWGIPYLYSCMVRYGHLRKIYHKLNKHNKVISSNLSIST